MSKSIADSIRESITELSGEGEEGAGTGEATSTPPAPAAEPSAANLEAPAPSEPPVGGVATPPAAPKAPEAPKQTWKPESWKPAIREKFGALPEDVRAEVQRREADIERGMREASEARGFHKEFTQTIAPYMPLIQAEGGTPMKAVQSLFQTAYLLRQGMPQQKVELVADMIRHYGIDVQMLDAALTARLTGQPAQHDPVISAVEQQLAPIRQFMERISQQTAQVSASRAAEVESEYQAFVNDPKNEFFKDVQEDVADILELASKRGINKTLQQAYDEAIMLHPEISKIVSARKLHQVAQSRSSVAAKAATAGASIGTDTPPRETPKPADPKNRRAVIEEAVRELAEKQSN